MPGSALPGDDVADAKPAVRQSLVSSLSGAAGVASAGTPVVQSEDNTQIIIFKFECMIIGTNILGNGATG
jgi:hypothetical protein